MAVLLKKNTVIARLLFFIVFLLSIVALASVLYLQEHKGLMPCPLCIFQRYSLILMAFFALLAALSAWRVLFLVASRLSCFFSVLGLLIAAWQSYIQIHPPAISQCGAGLEYMLNNNPLAVVLPKIFSGYGECSIVVWQLGFLTLPRLSFLFFLVSLIIVIRAILIYSKRQ